MDYLENINLNYGYNYLFEFVTTNNIHEFVELFITKKLNAALSFRMLPYIHIQKYVNDEVTLKNFFNKVLETQYKKNVKNYSEQKNTLKNVLTIISELMKEKDINKQYKNIKKYGIGVENPSKELLDKLKIKYSNLFIHNYNDLVIYNFYFLFVYEQILFKYKKFKYQHLSAFEQLVDSIVTKYRVESIQNIHVSVLKSAIQKYIRRSIFDKALWSASRLDLFYYGDDRAEGIRTNFIHRLMIIFLEDVGFCGIQYWKQLDFLLMDICIKNRKNNRNRNDEVKAIRYVIELLCDKKLYKTRACSHLNTVMSASPEVRELIEDTPYTDIFKEKVKKVKMTDSFDTKLKFAYYIYNKFSDKKGKEIQELFDYLSLYYPNKEIINIGKKWQKELKTKENFLTWCIILTDIVYTSDFNTRTLIDLNKTKFKNEQDNWNDEIDKSIEFDDYVYDKHTKFNKNVEKTTSYFASVSSIVIPESPLTNKWLKWIYMRVRGVDVEIPTNSEEEESEEEKEEKEESEEEKEESEEEESEKKFGKFKFRIQLTTSNNKTDVYMITKNDNDYIMKGPYKDDIVPKKYISMQKEKQKYNLPIIETKIVYLYPDRWSDGVGLGIRNKLSRTKKYPFLMIKSLIPASEFVLRKHSSKKWEETEVIDPEKTRIHFTELDSLNKQQLIDFYNALAYRMKHKYTDLAMRNFIIDDKRLYSIDEESVNEDFNLLNELKKSKYEFVKNNYPKYRKYLNEKLISILDEEFN